MKNSVREILRTVLWLLILLAVTVLFIRFVMQRTDVSGNSMLPMLENGDSLLVDKISYRFRDPKRFDIVVFPYHGEDTYFIKRIIGLPGETVQITEDGRIWINGELLEEHYGAEVIRDPEDAINPIVLGMDEYFVLGDNRNNSMDSRRQREVGNIKRSQLVGRAWLRVWPFASFGFLKHQ